jgi:hypothetical protein
MLSKRIALIALSATVLVAIAVFTDWYYPRTVENAAQLDDYVGHRIALKAAFDGDNKEYDLLYFDGVPLPVDHVNGSFEWPKTGQTIYVTGRLERNESVPVNSAYVIRDARWQILN